MHTFRTSLAFWGAAVALVMTYAASASPIPLYETWRSVDDLSYSDLSLSSVIYFVGAVSALLVFGRLSDYLGRKPVAVLALLLAGVASVLFLFVHSAWPLLTARLLQGLACGLASTAMTAWIVDTVKAEHKALPALLISVSPLVGLSIGSLGGGSLINFAPYPRTLVFAVSLLLLIASMLVLLIGQESVQRKPGVMTSLKPVFGLPDEGRHWYPAAAIAFTCTWAVGGFYQAFGPTIAAGYLHSATPVAAAIVFASFMLPSVLGSTLAARFSHQRALIIGMLVFMLAMIGVATSLHFGLLLPFLLCSACAGAAQGATMSGGIRSLMSGAQPHQRASTFSVIYGTAYTGAVIPTLIVGRLTSHFSLLELVSGYAVLAVVGWMLVTLLSLRARPTAAQQETAQV